MLAVATAFALALLTAPLATAQATRTWVSGVGDDANPCSRTAPCKTFAGAISKTAAGGEIDALDPGGFGAVTITKAITIDGGGGFEAGVLVSGTNGIVVQAGASDVVLIRNLTFEGLNTGLNGIRFLAGKALHVDRCFIHEFTQAGVDFEPNQATPSQLFVTATEITNNATGVLVKPAGGGTVAAAIERGCMDDNGVGLDGEDSSVTTVAESFLSGNATTGVQAKTAGASAAVNLQRCIVADNGVGVLSDQTGGGSTTLRLSETMVTGNTTGLQGVAGGAIVSFGNNQVSGNATNGAPTSTVPQS